MTEFLLALYFWIGVVVVMTMIHSAGFLAEAQTVGAKEGLSIDARALLLTVVALLFIFLWPFAVIKVRRA